jgi:hypothetical protein
MSFYNLQIFINRLKLLPQACSTIKGSAVIVNEMLKMPKIKGADPKLITNNVTVHRSEVQGSWFTIFHIFAFNLSTSPFG